MIWLGVALGSFGCYALKAAGMSVPRRVLDHPRVQHVADLLPVALLAALAATQTFADGRHLGIDARAVGVAVALVAIRLRAPFIIVVALAAATSALVRVIS